MGEDGPALYKLIIEHVQGVATAATIRLTQENLRKISLASYNNSVRDMHHAVHELNLTLTANSAVPEDMQHILLAAYKRSTNADFQQFACRTSDDIDYHDLVITTKLLMSKAEAKFDSLVAEGKWTVASKDSEAIVALQAAFQARDKPKHNHQHSKREPKERRVLQDKDYPPWKLIPPSKGEPKAKFVSISNKDGSQVNKEHHWCPVHRDGKGLWCTHTPSECKMMAAQKRKADGNSSNKRDRSRDKAKPAGSHKRTNFAAPKPQLVSNHVTLTKATNNSPENSDDDGDDDSTYLGVSTQYYEDHRYDSSDSE
jgi:hypothetical protein